MTNGPLKCFKVFTYADHRNVSGVTAELSVHGFAGTEEEQCGGDSHPQDADNEQR